MMRPRLSTHTEANSTPRLCRIYWAIALLVLVSAASHSYGQGGKNVPGKVADVEYAGAKMPEIRDQYQGAGQLPQMVLIQMYIFEVALEDNKDYGFIHRLQNRDGGISGAELGDLRSPTAIDLGVLDRQAGSRAPGMSIVGIPLNDDDGRIASEIQAFAQNRRSTTYSSPFILTLDGQDAGVSTGDEEPFLERSLAGDQVVFVQKFQPTGVNLRVLPTILDDVMIRVEITLDLSSVSGTRNEQGFQQPIVAKSSFQSIFDLKSGSSVLLGGVLRRINASTESGVPVARDLPLVGRLFRGTQDSTSRTEILIIIHPLIVDMESARNIEVDRQGGVVQPLRDRSEELHDTEPPIDQVYDLFLEGPNE